MSHVPIDLITVSENVSHFASLLHSLSQGTGSNQNTEKAQEPPWDIWRMLNMVDKWRRSCARLRALRERGVMRPLTHDSVCLVSDTERQPTREMGREREREGKKKEERGEARAGGWKTDGKVERSKGSRQTDPIKKEKYQEDIGRTLLLQECSNTLQAPKTHDQPGLLHNK